MRPALAYPLAAIWILCVCGLTVKHLPEIIPPANPPVGEASWSAAGLAGRAGLHVLGLLQLALMLLVAAGAGTGLVRLLGIGKGVGTRLALRLMCGLGIVCLLHQGLGLSGLLYRPLIGVLLFGLAALAVPYLLREKPWRLASPRPSLPGTLTGLLLLAAFLLARLPDTHWDPAVYHFAAPEHYLQLGKINAEPQHVYWHNPLGAEMIFLPAWAFGGITNAKLINVVFLLAGALILVRLARLVSGNAAGSSWSGVWFLSAGLVLDLAWQGKNDIAAATYLMAAAWCALRCARGGAGWLLCAGFFLGQAMGVKFTAWLPAAGLGAAMILYRAFAFPLSRWLAAGALCCAAFSGWLVASFLFLGNPMHPFLGSLFPDIGWNQFLHESYFAMDNALRPPESFSAFDPAGAGLWRAFGQPIHGSLGLFILFPAAFLLARGRHSALLKVAVIATCLLWFPTHRNPRYLFPAIPLVAVLASAAVVSLGRRERAFAAALAVITVTSGFLHGFPRLAGRAGGLYLAGAMTRNSFLETRYTTWESFRKWVNANLPVSSRIDLSGDERRIGFRTRVRSYSAVVEPTFWRLTRDSSSVDEVAKRVRQLGLTHLAHNFVSGEFRGVIYFPGPAWPARQLKLYAEVVRRHFRPVFLPARADRANGGFYLFEFAQEPEPAGYPLFLLPFTEGHFRTAWIAHSTGLFARALELARAAAGPMSESFQAQLVLGSINYRLGDYESAYRLLRPGADAGFLGSWGGWNLSLCGTAAINSGRYREGIELMEKAFAVTGEPEHLNAAGMGLIGSGQDKQKSGDISGAIEDFRRALSLLTDSELKYRLEQKIRHLGVHP